MKDTKERRAYREKVIALFNQGWPARKQTPFPDFLKKFGISHNDLSDLTFLGSMTVAIEKNPDTGMPRYGGLYMTPQDTSNHEMVALRTLELLTPGFLPTLPFKHLTWWGRGDYLTKDLGGICSQSGEHVNMTYRLMGEPLLGISHVLLHELGHSAEAVFPRIPEAKMPDEYINQRKNSLQIEPHNGAYTDLLPFFALFPDSLSRSWLNNARYSEEEREHVENFREKIIGVHGRQEKQRNLLREIVRAEESRGWIQQQMWGRETTERYVTELNNLKEMFEG